jgi:hypothetical protein
MGEWRYSSTPRINLGSRWRRVVRFAPWQLYPRGTKPGTQRTGNRVGPEPIWTVWLTGKFLPCRESNPGRSSRCPVTVLFEFSRLLHSFGNRIILWREKRIHLYRDSIIQRKVSKFFMLYSWKERFCSLMLPKSTDSSNLRHVLWISR